MKTLKKILTGMLIIALANVGMLVINQDVALAANCNLYSTTDFFGNTTTSGNCGGSRVNVYSSTDSFGNTNTWGSIGNSRINSYSSTDSFGNTNTWGSISCFWNC